MVEGYLAAESADVSAEERSRTALFDESSDAFNRILVPHRLRIGRLTSSREG